MRREQFVLKIATQNLKLRHTDGRQDQHSREDSTSAAGDVAARAIQLMAAARPSGISFVLREKVGALTLGYPGGVAVAEPPP